MKFIQLFTLLILVSSCSNAQKEKGIIKVNPDDWTVYNREVSINRNVIHLDAQEGDGLCWLNNSEFKNGTIELDIKGNNVPGKSFVGVAFHGLDNTTYDGIYFRPFNFKNPERNSHSVQYISMPGNDWSALRNAYPGKYENVIRPVPDPVDNWFHVKIVVEYPSVKVYVNDFEEPTLEVEQISDQKTGQIGLWVGNGSEGWFKNVNVE